MSGLGETLKLEEQVLMCITELIEAGRDSLPILRRDSKIKDYLDSFNMIRLLTLLENECGILFEYADLNEGNWVTPSTVVELICKKRGAA